MTQAFGAHRCVFCHHTPIMHNMWQQFNCFSSSCCACADTGFFYFSLSFYIVATAVNFIWLVRLLASRAAC